MLSRILAIISIFLAISTIYLASSNYRELPDKIPIHIDSRYAIYSSKNYLFLPAAIQVSIILLASLAIFYLRRRGLIENKENVGKLVETSILAVVAWACSMLFLIELDAIRISKMLYPLLSTKLVLLSILGITLVSLALSFLIFLRASTAP